MAALSLGEGHPVLIGTRAVGTWEPVAGTNLDETPYRVVIWAVAVPTARRGDAWTLYLFQSGGGGARPRTARGRDTSARWTSPGFIPAAGGGAITAFSVDRRRCGGRVQRPLVRRSRLDGWAGWQPFASAWLARLRCDCGGRPWR